MEIWGGIECTINRVGDQYFDQLTYQGHYTRKEDLKMLSDLGIKKIRYPILWEKHLPERNGVIDWSFTAGQVEYLTANNIDVIAGLVHHGSGPAYVNMLDETFSTGLPAYAEQVAMQFPWIKYYTPVNEPLTTARFCGLYGLWYPHKNDDASFLRILYNECKATALAMQAIRRINPEAMLVHTEDIGKTHATKLLQYQADFENKRRWIGLDLLCGMVDENHDLYEYLIKHGITPDELRYFTENPCPPDILGFNHYITSERFLDERLDLYPPHTHGRNGKHAYADVEAVRSSDAVLAGPKALLNDAWQRYGMPLAITEAHLHCGREDQLRWLNYIIQAAEDLEAEGVDIRGVTVWSLFGAYGWDRLLTTSARNYESGAFDVRTGEARLTQIAKMVADLAKGKGYIHPVLEQHGWWQRNDRILYPRSGAANIIVNPGPNPLLIIGSDSTLGMALVDICNHRNINFVGLSSKQLNLSSIQEIEAAINKYRPWAVVNAADFYQVEDAELDRENCFLTNTVIPANLAICCKKSGVQLLTFSSDQVFDGRKNSEYTESDSVNPLNLLGLSKARAEEQVLRAYPEALVVRSSEIFSNLADDSAMSRMLVALSRRESIDVADDVFISPTLVSDLIHSSLDLLIDGEAQIWHVANQGTISWADLAGEVASRAGYSSTLLVRKPYAELNFNAARPSYSGLTSDRGVFLPRLENALDRYFSVIS
ncbi:family 1 glycosylhydrolase [Pedobacter sp. SAFR-022]|uniref:family 1 glycosylhydrolase n=1 Tax=Pedobacter sp. SAFR-022 TaxID=3436861 RepID=UPI003F7D92D8